MPDFTRDEIQWALLYGATPNLAGANLEGAIMPDGSKHE